LESRHPEKVLMVRGDFAAKRDEEHIALVAALLEAGEFCGAPENHARVIETLARREFVGVSESALRHGIDGEMDFGHDLKRTVRDFCVFYRDDANEPSGDKAAWALDLVRASGLCQTSSALSFAFAKKVFRPDIFNRAAELRRSFTAQIKPERMNECQPAFA
jgi:hypothetical protein